MSPQCLYGEDEMDCGEEYKKRGLINKDATFSCYSPHYYPDSPIKRVPVTILGVRCDGKEECHGGEDEKNCKNSTPTYGNILIVGPRKGKLTE